MARHGKKDPKFLREQEGLMNRFYGGAAQYANFITAEKQNRRKAKKALALKKARALAEEEM